MTAKVPVRIHLVIKILIVCQLSFLKELCFHVKAVDRNERLSVAVYGLCYKIPVYVLGIWLYSSPVTCRKLDSKTHFPHIGNIRKGLPINAFQDIREDFCICCF